MDVIIYCKLHFRLFIAFAFKHKKLCNCLSRFFSFSPSRHFFRTDCQKLFSQRFMISYQESVWPRSDSFLGHAKKSFRKNCSSTFYSWRVWHITRLMHGNQLPSMKRTLMRWGDLSYQEVFTQRINK